MIGHFQITPRFSTKMICLYRSWGWARNDFAEEFFRLSDAGAFRPDGTISQIIWQTRNKFVLRTETAQGFSVAYKSFLRIKNFHQYLLRPSSSATEAINYMRLEKTGLPLPDLLAVGETRCGFLLKNAFMVSRFAEGFRDGRDFCCNGIYADDRAKLREFVCGNLKLLAMLHDAGMRHRGFAPYNLLYRLTPDGMKLCWIDVADCQRSIISAKTIAEDMINLFKFLPFSPEERGEFERQYLNVCRRHRPNFDDLFDSVEKQLVGIMQK